MISHRPYFLAATLPKLISIPLCAVLAFLFSAASVATLFAQPLASPGGKPLSQYVRDLWTTDNGLPQNSPVGLMQTRDGYLWFGTQEGLVRFDGLKFTVYDGTTVDAMRSRNVSYLYEDADSSLWIGANGGGALRLKSGVFTGFHNKQGLPGGTAFTGFRRLRSGVFLAATYYGLFASRNPLTEKFQPYPDTSFQRLPTAAILESQGNDTLWIGSLGGLIAVLGGKRVATYTVKDGLADNNINALCEDRRGRLIVGTAHGVSVREGGRFKTYTVKDGLQNEGVAVLTLDAAGTLWLGSPSGLMRFPGGVIDFARTDAVSGFDVRSVCRDREGSIWIGTSATGLIRLRDSKFTNITAEDGLPGDVVFPMLLSRDGSVWIGTDRRGISQVRGGKVVKTFYNRANNEFDSQSFAEDGDGNLWLGSRGLGVKVLRQGNLTSYTVKDGLANDAIAVMQAGTDTDGKPLMWLGTQGGLCKFKDGRFSTLDRPLRSIDNPIVQVLGQSRDGGLLLANFFGYSRFKNGKFTTVGYPDSIYTGIAVICEDIDAPGTLWIATTGAGLIRFKDGHFTRIRAKHGLFDDVMWTLIDDRLGYFWTSSNKGVSRLSKKDLNAFADSAITSFTCNVFGTADGMKNRECNSSAPAGLRDRDGKLWFSTVKGAAIIDPKNLLPNKIPPPVIIETVRIDSATFLQPPAAIEAGASRFEFHYAGLSFIAPEKVTYKYQLTGFDKTWIEAGANRAAYYTNLPSGDYTFKVIAANNDGVWNDAGASVSFTLRPYFYQTPWFYGLCAIGFVALGAGGYGLRVRQLQREQSRLSRLVDERTEALSAEKEKLAAAYSTIEIDNDRKTKELEDARQLQFSMLPKDVPQMPGLDIAVYMKTATEVGGDYYDFKILSDGTLIAAIGDATGHGMKAGIMVATAKSYFQTFASEQGNLPTLSQISDGIKRMNLRGLYMGLTLLRYKQPRLDVAAAGMPPLFFYRSKSAAVERVVLKGMPLGSFTNFPYQEFSTTLEPGDAVLLVSDGLEEMFNAQREMLGLGAVEAEFTRVATSAPATAIERLVSIAETWAAGTPQADDMTLMILKLK